MYGMAGIYLSYLQKNNINYLNISGETSERLIDIVREVRELFHHTVGRHNTLSQSYVFRFIVNIIPVIPYLISTF